MTSRSTHSAKDARPASRWRWPIRLILAVVVPALVLVGFEGGLRLVGLGYPTGYFIDVDGHDAYTSNPRFGWRFFPRRLSREPQPMYVPADKAPNVFRIFVFGGSAAQGIPDPAFSFSRILEVMLEAAYPETRSQVFNTAMTAINSHVVLPIARDCASHAPDLYVVYMGNNEVRGPFGAGTAYQSFSPSLGVIRASIAAKSLRLGQVLEGLSDIVTGRQRSGPREWRGMEMNLANAVPADGPRLAKVHADFRANLTDICLAGLDAGADIALCTVGVNLKDCPPFASMHRAELSEANLAEWDETFQQGLHAEKAGQPALAAEHFARAVAIDPRHAEGQFRLGRSSLAAGQLDRARVAMRLARDLDGLRFRTDGRLNEIVREVPGEFDSQKVWLVDVERRFDDVADTPGLPGRELLYEHVHMTFAGNYVIARALFDAVSRSSRFRTRRPAVVLGEDACAKQLVLTPWKQRIMALYTAKMMSRPPFETQRGNDARVAYWTDQVAQAKARQTEAAAAQACKDYTAALAAHPDDVEMRYEFGRFLLNDLRRYEDAERQFRLVLERLPNISRYALRLGRSLRAQGRLAEATDAFERAVALSPRPAEIAAKIAGIYHIKGATADALAWAERALAMESDVGEALRIAGDIYAEHGRFHAAAETLATYLAQRPRLEPRSEAVLHCTLAMCLARIGRADEGAAHLAQAVEIDPTFGLPHALRARVHRDAGEDALAAQSYRQAVALEPSSVPLRIEMAMLLATSGDPRARDAESAAQQAMEAVRLTDERGPTAWHALAVAYAAQGRFDEAVEAIDKALRGAPDASPRQTAVWLRHRQMFLDGVAPVRQAQGVGR